jgi:alkylation response protein AidB-like acyl-CoA dehydrogenase
MTGAAVSAKGAATEGAAAAPLTAADLEAMRSALRAFLAAASNEEQVRANFDSEDGGNLEAWHALVEQFGVAGVLISTDDDGLDLGYVVMATVLEETGRALFTGPLFASAVLATSALLGAGDDTFARQLLRDLADGTRIAAVALNDEAAHPTRFRAARDGWVLDGIKTAVLDAASADVVLVVASDESREAGLFEIRPGDARVEPLDVLDRTRRQARVVLTDTPARRLGADYTGALAALNDVGAVAAAAEQLGVAQRALDLAVEYAKVREQFGVPIGSFQAVKHMCAEMLALVESQRAAVRAAAAALDDAALSRAEVSETASVAKAFSSDAAVAVVETTIQVLGGIGFTWEHPAHLYLRRARSLQHAFGDAPFHRSRLADLVDAAALKL